MTTENEIYMMKLANARLQEIYELKEQIATLNKGQQDVLDQITIVKTESGEVIAVTLTDEEHRILKVIWQKEHETGTDNPIDFPVEVKEDLVLNLDRDDLYNLMLKAHEQDITLNQLVENVLRERIEEALLDKGSLEQSSEV